MKCLQNALFERDAQHLNKNDLQFNWIKINLYVTIRICNSLAK